MSPIEHGDVVHYKLSATDCRMVDVRRQHSHERTGAPMNPGDTYPAMAVVVCHETEVVSLRVILAGYDEFWAPRRREGPGKAQWSMRNG